MSCPPLTPCNPCNNCPPEGVTILPACPDTEPCEELIDAACVVYNGPNLTALGVTDGMRLKEALVKLNKIIADLGDGFITSKYVITVTPSQTTTVVEYVDATGAIQSVSVSKDQSPVDICAVVNSPVKISGTGTFASDGPCVV
jgi:hypothetical protein